MKNTLVLLAFMMAAAAAHAFSLPFDERADAEADLAQAFSLAAAGNRQVLILFGANWCSRCRQAEETVRTIVARGDREFVTVRVDIGNLDRNTALIERYGNPPLRELPAAVVANAAGGIVYAGPLSRLKLSTGRHARIVLAVTGVAAVALLLASMALFMRRRVGGFA